MWKPKDWEKHFKKPGDPLFRETFDLGADTMHLADIDYLEEHKVLVNLNEKGKVKITFKFTIEEWLAFSGKEIP